MLQRLEKLFEACLWKARWMVVLAVVSSLTAAFILVLIGTVDIILVIKECLQLFHSLEDVWSYQTKAFSSIIVAMDAFLISTVLLIFGLGLYELFISKIDAVERDEQSSRVLVVHSLDELKGKLAKVIVMVLVVTFFKHAISLNYENVKNLVLLGVGILMVSAALYLLNARSGEKNDEA